MLKKTRPEKPDRPNIFQDKGYSSNSSPHDRGESIDGLVMPTNPYQVKPEPDKVRRNEPKSEPENPYQVKPEPDNPYLVKPQPDMPHKDRKLPPKAKGSNRCCRVCIVSRIYDSLSVRDLTPHRYSRVLRSRLVYREQYLLSIPIKVVLLDRVRQFRRCSSIKLMSFKEFSIRDRGM